MKRLKLANIGYPIYAVETTFAYRKVGRPTVFDELLMSLAIEFPQLRQNSLAQIAEILKLDENFIRQSLENMSDTGMIEIDEMDDLSQIQLADLALTEIGWQFYQNKQMPSRRRTASTEFYFNPISQKYGDKPSKSEKSDVLLEQSLFPVNDNILQVLSQKEVPYQNWYTEEVTVEENGIEHYVEQEGFQAAKVQLNLDNNHHLQIESSNELFNDWLKNRSAEVIKAYLLKPLLQKDNDVLNDYFDDEIAELDCQDDELLSFVLASGQLDMAAVKSAIPVQFSQKQKLDKKQPAVVFLASAAAATLDGKHLYLPHKTHDILGGLQLLFEFNSNNVFIEKIGYFPCYFDHQSYDLPVKILIKQQQNWFSEMSYFKEPNFDTLVFMANFLSEDELLVKIPKMNLSTFHDFYQKISQTWGKNLVLNQDWINKTDLITDEKELKWFVKYFDKTPLRLQYFHQTIQGQLFDLAIKNEQSAVHQIVELKELFKLYSVLKSLNNQKLDLKTVTAENLNHIQQWQNVCDELRHTYPAVLSDSLNQATNQITAWKAQVQTLFVQSSEKVAVLDTNFVRKHSKDELAKIAENHQVILPGVVLDELDYQKEKSKKDIRAAETLLSVKESKSQSEWKKVGELTEQIKMVNTKQQMVQSDIDAVQAEAKPLRAIRQKDEPMSPELKALEQRIGELVKDRKEQEEKKSTLNKQKQQAEKSAKQADTEQETVQKELDKLNNEGFEIREAVRKIEELALSKHSEQSKDEILALLGGNEQNTPKNSQNDNAVLAVALRHKLSEVVLYTEDKNLKNKAVSYGIHTVGDK